MGGSITLGSFEKMVRSATPSRVKQLGHIFPSLPLALLEVMCVMVVMGDSIISGGIAEWDDVSDRHGVRWRTTVEGGCLRETLLWNPCQFQSTAGSGGGCKMEWKVA